MSGQIIESGIQYLYILIPFQMQIQERRKMFARFFLSATSTHPELRAWIFTCDAYSRPVCNN